MLYLGGLHNTRVGGLRDYAAWLGRLTGNEMPASVRRFFSLHARREADAAKRAAALEQSHLDRQRALRQRRERVMAAMTPDERARWDAVETELETAHGKRRKRLSEKQTRLFCRVADRLGD